MKHKKLSVLFGAFLTLGVLGLSAAPAEACSPVRPISSCQDADQRLDRAHQAIAASQSDMTLVNRKLKSNGDMSKCTEALKSEANCIHRVKNKTLFEFVQLKTGNTCQDLPSFRADFLCSEVAETNIAARNLKDQYICQRKYEVRRTLIELRLQVAEAKAYIQKFCAIAPKPPVIPVVTFNSLNK